MHSPLGGDWSFLFLPCLATLSSITAGRLLCSYTLVSLVSFLPTVSDVTDVGGDASVVLGAIAGGGYGHRMVQQGWSRDFGVGSGLVCR